MFSSEAVERVLNNNRIPSTVDVATTGHPISPTNFQSVNNSNSITTNNKRRTHVRCNDESLPFIESKEEVKIPSNCRGNLIVDLDELDSPCSSLVEVHRNFNLLHRYPARKRQKKSHHVDPSVMALAISTASIVDAEIHHLLNGIAELENLLGDRSQESSSNIIDRSLPSNLGVCMKQKCAISQGSGGSADSKPVMSGVQLQRSVSASTSSSSLSSLKNENNSLCV